MKPQGCIRTVLVLCVIFFLIAGFSPAHLVQAAPPAAALASPDTFECSSVTSIPLIECQALTALYNQTNGQGWTNSSGWLTTTTPCTWFGIVCADGHVTEIKLYNNQLKGTIPVQLANLTALTGLNLPNNQLTGTLPAELGQLANLKVLYVSGNQLSGPIPPEIGNLSNLQYLVAWENQLSGTIPPELGKLNNLMNLSLRSNQLDGALPAEIGSLANLRTADFTTNQFCGAIPVGLGSLTLLGDLRLSGNHFLIPSEPLYSQINAKTTQDHSWNANQTPGDCGGTLLALYVLAFDNDPLSTANLTAYYPQTIASIASATANRTGVRAVVLADQSGPDNVAVLEISNGIVTQVTENLPTLSEGTVVNGAELGGFLKWARDTYPAQRTTLTYLGHNKPLPQAGLDTLPADKMSGDVRTASLFPLPIKDGAHADYTDNTPQALSLSIYDFGEALRLGSADGAQPFDVVDISSCFSMSFEEMYALRRYTLTAVGSPNYNFFEPALAGYSLKAIGTSMTAAQMASALVSIKDSVLPADGHPRILVALDMSKLDGLKDAWDSVSYSLWQGLSDPQQRQSFKEKMAKAYNYSHKYDCTYCQPQDWALETPDALVDLGSFAQMLRYQFGETSPVGVAAGSVSSDLSQAVLARAIRNGVPWFGNPNKSWDFSGNAGLSLYADLVGRDDTQGHIVLNDIAAWYNRTVSSSNPHPYEFVLAGNYGKDVQPNGINWSDVFTAYWQNATNLLTRLCLPTFPAVTESGDIIAGSILSPVARMAHQGSPVTLSATVTSTTEVHNVQVSILVYQNSHQVFTDTVTVPTLLAGAQVAVQSSQAWTPTEAGQYTVRFFFDSNNHIVETNEKNNLVYFTDSVDGVSACPRAEISASILQNQQWWSANTIQLVLAQTSQTAVSDAAQVNQLVIDFYQYEPGINPNTQVPHLVEQRTISSVSLPQSNLALPLPAAIKPGTIVIHIWPKSACGGVGIPRELTFNYLPTNTHMANNQQQYFTFDAIANQKVDLTLNVTGGSARMYVWLPGNYWSAQAITGTGTLTIDPTGAGRYLVNVESSADDTVYTLTAVLNGEKQLDPPAVQADRSAGAVTTSVVTVSRTRPDFAEPLFTSPDQNHVFLPFTMR